MKLHRLFLVALMASAFAIVGCGDNNGGGDASSVCDACDADALKPSCETAYNVCIQEDVLSAEDCVAAGLLACGVV
jgi:uncharacterized protein YgiB involved in biofilm formation